MPSGINELAVETPFPFIHRCTIMWGPSRTLWHHVPSVIAHNTENQPTTKARGHEKRQSDEPNKSKWEGAKMQRLEEGFLAKIFGFYCCCFVFFLQISKVSEFQGPREGLGIEIFSKYKVSRILEWKHIAKKSSYISWTRKYSSAVSLQQLLKPFIFPGCEGWSKQTCLLYLMGNKFIRLVPAAPLTTRLSSSDVTFGCEEALWKACQYKTGSASPLPLKH